MISARYVAKAIFLSSIFILSLTELFACDMCGCFMGIHPSDRRSFGGIFYRYRSFSGDAVKGSNYFPDGGMKIAHSDHTGSVIPDDSYEIYRAVEFRGRYYLHSRLELNVVLPYLMNSSEESGNYTSLNGLGDLTLLAGWQLLDEAYTGSFRHRLLLGAGVKLATGKDDVKVNGERHPLMMQCGTGSNDVLLYSNYQLGYKNWGMGLTPLYKLNGENRYGEKVGDSKTIFGSVFYAINVHEKLKILPSAQAYYEYSKGVFMDGEFVKATRMNVMMCGPGLDVYWKNIGCSASALITTYEDDNGSGLTDRIRLMAGITLYFDQSHFIF